jgi:hypothetical protein
MDDMRKYVEELSARAAAEKNDGVKAMQFSQAANNVANAMATLNNIAMVPKLPKPDADGFFPHDGSDVCPVADMARVDLLMRDRSVRSCVRAGGHTWGDHKTFEPPHAYRWDIIGWRPSVFVICNRTDSHVHHTPGQPAPYEFKAGTIEGKICRCPNLVSIEDAGGAYHD